MSDHEVKILVTAEVRDFQKQLKEAGNSTKDLQKMSTRFRKDGVKGHKDISAASKMVNKGQLKAAKESINHEKELQKQIKETAKLLREKAKMFKGNVDAIHDEIQALKKLETELAKSQALRHGVGHRSMGERFRGTMPNRGDWQEMNQSGGRMLGRGLQFAAGAVGLGVGFMAGQANQAYGARERFEIAQGGLVGMGGSYNAASGQRYGYSMTDTAAQAAGIGRATGNIGAVTQAQALSRGFGMDVGESGAIMGTLRASGHQFSGSDGRGGSGNDQLKKIIAAGFASGLERARMPEFIEGVGALVSTAQRSLSGQVNGEGYAGLLAMLGRSGQPGMQGAAGAGVLAKLDAGIKAPGGGDAGRAILMQALGFGTPGGTLSYTDVLRQMEKGASDPSNLRKILETSAQRNGNASDGQALELQTLFPGLGLSQVDSVVSALGQGNFDGAFAMLQEQMAASKSIEEQGLDEMKGMGHTLEHIARLENRLVDMGEPIMESTRNMQEVLNDTIAEGWPAVVSGITTIAQGVRIIADLVQHHFGDESSANVAMTNQIDESLRDRMNAIVPNNGSVRSLSDTQLATAISQAQSMTSQARQQAGIALDQTEHNTVSRGFAANGQWLGAESVPTRGSTPESQRLYEAYRQMQTTYESLQVMTRDLTEELQRRRGSEVQQLDTIVIRSVSAQTTATGATPEPGVATRGRRR